MNECPRCECPEWVHTMFGCIGCECELSDDQVRGEREVPWTPTIIDGGEDG